MFFISKLIGFFTQPLLWVLALFAIALLWNKRKPHAARRAGWCAVWLWLALSWLPLPNLLIQHLESQYPEWPPATDTSRYAGVIVLGGATESGAVSQAHVQPLLNDAAERMTAAVALLRHNPQLHMIFTGGEGALLGSGPSEADRAKVFFDTMGIRGDQVQYESASRNTYENATLSAQLPGVDIGRPWLLVTSATHMPRSMATFTKAGWNVSAYPVDFHTGGDTAWTDFSLSAGPNRWDMLLHEWLGLLAYRLTGRM